MLSGVLEALASTLRALLYVAALVAAIGALSHLVAWLLSRRGGLRWVWNYWYPVGAALLAVGLLALGYGWLALGARTDAGSVLIALGMLLVSAGLWMMIPV